MTKENKEKVNKIYTDIGAYYKLNINKTYRNRIIASILIYGLISIIAIVCFFINKSLFLLIASIVFLVLLLVDIRSAFKQRKIELDKSDIELGQDHYLDNKFVIGHNDKVFKYYFKNVGIIIICLIVLGLVCIFTYFDSVKKDDFNKYIDVYGNISYIEYTNSSLKIGLVDNNCEYRLNEIYIGEIDTQIESKVMLNDNVILKVSNTDNKKYGGNKEEITEYNYMFYIKINDVEYLSYDSFSKITKSHQIIRLIIGLVTFLVSLLLALYLSILKIITNKNKTKEEIDINQYLDKKEI